MLLQTPGTTASAAIQGQDVESFKSGAQAASMDVDSSQKMDAGKQSETPGWQAETLRNRSLQQPAEVPEGQMKMQGEQAGAPKNAEAAEEQENPEKKVLQEYCRENPGKRILQGYWQENPGKKRPQGNRRERPEKQGPQRNRRERTEKQGPQRNRRKRPEKKGLQGNRWQVIRMCRKGKEHCSLRPERWYRKAGCI